MSSTIPIIVFVEPTATCKEIVTLLLHCCMDTYDEVKKERKRKKGMEKVGEKSIRRREREKKKLSYFSPSSLISVPGTVYIYDYKAKQVCMYVRTTTSTAI